MGMVIYEDDNTLWFRLNIIMGFMGNYQLPINLKLLF